MQNLSNYFAAPDMLGGLGKLARRGAFATLPADAAGPVELECDRHGEVLSIGVMDRVMFAAAVEHGLCARDGDRWRITATGRGAVRQFLSERARLRSTMTAGRDADRPGVATTPMVNEDESPLVRLARRLDRHGRPLITAEQLAAGERLRNDLWLARLTPRVTQSWSGIALSRKERRGAPGAGIAPSDSAVAAQERARRALVAAGHEYLDLLFDVCGHLKGLEEIERTASLPQRSARRFLQLGLTALARHYGLLPPADVERRVTHRLRHWGAEDYRPRISATEPPV